MVSESLPCCTRAAEVGVSWQLSLIKGREYMSVEVELNLQELQQLKHQLVTLKQNILSKLPDFLKRHESP
jgi:uncharacterized protein (DUF736 family)